MEDARKNKEFLYKLNRLSAVMMVGVMEQFIWMNTRWLHYTAFLSFRPERLRFQSPMSRTDRRQYTTTSSSSHNDLKIIKRQLITVSWEVGASLMSSYI